MVAMIDSHFIAYLMPVHCLPIHPPPVCVQADVIAGLKPGEGEALTRIDKNWQTNGKFGVIQFAP